MKLYLKIDRKEGKMCGYLDRKTLQAKRVAVLYPHKPTEVPDKAAELMLEQNPHLVSKTPFREESGAKKGGRKRGRKSGAEAEKELEEAEKEVDEEVKGLAKQILAYDEETLMKLDEEDIRSMAAHIGLALPEEADKAEQISLVLKRAKEISG